MSQHLKSTNCSHNDSSPNHQHDHSHADHKHSHDHSHAGHSHSHFSLDNAVHLSTKLKISTAITLLFVVAEVGAGLYAGSLALVSDAAHNFVDALALIIALIAVWLQNRPATISKTYGYNRAGILAAFINSATLMVIVVGLIYSAIERMIQPHPVQAGLMFWVALVGLIVNTTITYMLHKDSHDDINIRSAYLHMLSDVLGTVSIIIGSIIIYYTGYFIIDAIMSLLLSIMIMWTTWSILQETVHLLLDGAPKSIDVDSVTDAIQSVPGVKALHHIHIWGIASRMTALSCHLQVEDMHLSSCEQILSNVNNMLKIKFSIEHTTLQLETKCNEGKKCR